MAAGDTMPSPSSTAVRVVEDWRQVTDLAVARVDGERCDYQQAPDLPSCDRSKGHSGEHRAWGVPPGGTHPTPIALAREAVARAATFRAGLEADGGQAYERALTAEQKAIALLSTCCTAEARGVAGFMQTAAWSEILAVLREELDAGAMARVGARLDAVRVAAERR